MRTEYLHGSDKHHDNRGHSVDEENEIPVRDRIFKCLSQLLDLLDDIMKGRQNTNYPKVSNETGKEEQPNKYGGDEYRQNTTSYPVQTLSEHKDQVLKQQNDDHPDFVGLSNVRIEL